jgi:hypothetical protein
MIADWSRIVRLGLVVSLAVVSVASPGRSSVAWAQDEDEDEGGDEEEEEDGEEEEEEDEDQPPVTAGGLFSKENYPISELQRPLTITKGMTELRLGIDIDMSAANAFGAWGIGANARYGLEDNVELQADFRSDLTDFNDLRIAAALEASIVYDLVDVRVGAVVPYVKDAPDGTSKFDFELGFPFRYAPKEQVGVVALDTFMTFNTSGKPDLTPSVGIVVQPVEPLAIKLQAQIIIRDFNTDAGNFLVPASLNIQFSPTNLIDFGGEFSFPNLKAEDDPATTDKEEKFYDKRFLLLYGQIRI